ncbi:Short-chain dehydrogenase/reductase SDR [Penicillium sp. IBT 35674x]|nr:Short-chain dehydrogenase/reductase SDR [Penicillium sp. IBT 35674x]
MITGGTSGIGFAIADRFLQEGASSIILVGRSRERLEAAATNLHSSDKVRLLVGDVAEAGTWMRDLEKEMTNVDVLVNAAGISVTNILPRSELEDISKILRTNLEGAILTSRALMRAAIRSRVRNRNAAEGEKKPSSRCIINISSLLALKAGTGAVPYAASKAGLLGLTRSLAVEASASLKDVVIRSNAILPGYIETPMIADFTPGEVGRLNDTIPLHRFGKPSEVADAAVFLAQNEYANNCVLNLDGGLSAV